MKLYKVTTRLDAGPSRVAYALAEDSAEAYQLVRDFLDKHDIGFSHKREMESVELIAEAVHYPNSMRLFPIIEDGD